MKTTSVLIQWIALAFLVVGIGGCRERGCTDPAADNYDPFAELDGRCIYRGCTDSRADNFSSGANLDDGSCIYSGCTDPTATNYNPLATRNDSSCVYNNTGTVAFWSSVQCCAIQVYLNNQDVGLIEYYFEQDPGCVQQQGVILLNLTEGTYPFTAETVSGGTFTWDGTITIQRGSCLTHELFL